jgi:hypothetical protein
MACVTGREAADEAMPLMLASFASKMLSVVCIKIHT